MRRAPQATYLPDSGDFEREYTEEKRRRGRVVLYGYDAWNVPLTAEAPAIRPDGAIR